MKKEMIVYILMTSNCTPVNSFGAHKHAILAKAVGKKIFMEREWASWLSKAYSKLLYNLHLPTLGFRINFQMTKSNFLILSRITKTI